MACRLSQTNHDPGMLDRAIGIEQFRAHRPDTGPHRLSHHGRQPVFIRDLNIIVAGTDSRLRPCAPILLSTDQLKGASWWITRTRGLPDTRAK
jgi:hypothetical protein